jgi:hypothetical protein
MKTLVNGLLIASLLALAALNVAVNPFAARPAQAQEQACEGSPPGEYCTCCESCGCWSCFDSQSE